MHTNSPSMIQQVRLSSTSLSQSYLHLERKPYGVSKLDQTIAWLFFVSNTFWFAEKYGVGGLEHDPVSMSCVFYLHDIGQVVVVVDCQTGHELAINVIFFEILDILRQFDLVNKPINKVIQRPFVNWQNY
jgi:hypothetical protein